jgi:iron complex outermembrane receptor protein
MSMKCIRGMEAGQRPGNSPLRLLLTTTSLAACTILATPSHAQTGAAATPVKDPPALAPQDAGTSDTNRVAEVVVVQARRKAERLQNVPLSITALSSKELKAAGATSLEDITFLTPGLTYTSNGQQADATPVIRGLADTSGGEATSQNVSVFLDGVYFANPSAIDLSLAGLDHVEIVKGPVSGLYGRNAFTGAVNYVTAKPSQEFYTDESVTIGNDGRYVVDGNVTGGIVPGILSGRLAFTYNHLDGTFTDPVTHVDGNGHDRKDFMASLLLTPNEHISIEPFVYYGYDEFNAPVNVIYKQNCALGTSDSYCGNLNDNQIGPAIPSSSGADTTGLTRRVEHLHVDNRAVYDFGTFDVLVAFNKITTLSNNDFTGTDTGLPYALYAAGANNPFAGDPTVGQTNLKSFFGDHATEEDSSVEARYDTPQTLPVRVGIGGYWFYHAATNNNLFGVDGGGIPAGDQINFIAQNYVTPQGGPGAPLNYSKDATRDWSGFISGEWDIIPTLTLSTAVRDTDEAQRQFSKANGDDAAEFHQITSNEALTYKPTPNLTFYVSAANGAKSGGFNGAATDAADNVFQPETDWDYEGGVKTILLDHHLLLNADVFHTDISNLQVLGPPANGSIGLVVGNFGSLSETGFEVSGDYVVGNGLKFSSGIEYGEPRLQSGSYDFNDGAACALVPSCANSRLVVIKGQQAVNLNGLAPPYSSDLTFNLTAEYRRPTYFWENVEWFARGDYRLESKQYNGLTNFAYYGPRNVLGLHAGLDTTNWTFSGNILNVTNDLTPVTMQFNGSLNGFDAPPLGDFGVFWQPTSVLPEGRTFYFKLGYHF